MRSRIHCAALGTWLMTTALLLGALTGCKTADLYRTGYDKRLTEQAWANRAPDDAVVIIGGYRSVWQKADDASYSFETRQRFKIDWTHTFDVALLKPGTYQLETLVLPDGSFAEFGGFQGLGAKDAAVMASFQVGPGEVVYVGDLDALVLVEDLGTCSANLSAQNTYVGVVSAFAKQVPYVGRQPTINMMTINQSLVRFPCGQGG
jgi:hypothetical protein